MLLADVRLPRIERKSYLRRFICRWMYGSLLTGTNLICLSNKKQMMINMPTN